MIPSHNVTTSTELVLALFMLISDSIPSHGTLEQFYHLCHCPIFPDSHPYLSQGSHTTGCRLTFTGGAVN